MEAPLIGDEGKKKGKKIQLSWIDRSCIKVNIFHRNLQSSLPYSMINFVTASFSISAQWDNEFRVEALIHVFLISTPHQKQAIFTTC